MCWRADLGQWFYSKPYRQYVVSLQEQYLHGRNLLKLDYFTDLLVYLLSVFYTQPF